MTTIAAFAGSLRSGSFNRLLLRAARECAPEGMEIRVWDDLASIPFFNEDLERDPAAVPAGVRSLRDAVASADGLLVATPEYNHSMPAVVKNAVDWLSRAGPAEVLVGKPVAVIGATSGQWGTRLAQAALRQTFYATQSLVMPSPCLFVREAGRLFDPAGRLTDAPTSENLRALLESFARWIDATRVFVK